MYLTMSYKLAGIASSFLHDPHINYESVNVNDNGLKVNEKRAKLMCINGVQGKTRWKNGTTYIDEIEEY